VPDAYVGDANRTPFGRYGGGQASVRPDDLAAHAVRALLDRLPSLDHEQIDDTTAEKLGKLRPAFVKDGTVTAGNSSPLNDGAGAMLITDEAGAAALGRDPLARIVGRGVAGADPDVFGIAPVEAANRALARAGIGWDDVAVVELNEAFASQCLADMSQWDGLDPEKVNPNGGAIALGHPLGASGVRILGSLVHELGRRGGGYGVAALCIGVGQGLALVVHA
jgi:acetyl-CoA acetyltransferase family protein